MSKGNLAYDLARYENATVKPKRKKEDSVKIQIRKMKAETRGSAPKIIVLTLAAGLLLGTVVYGKVENASVHTEINNQTKNVDILRSENVRMQTEIESKTALKTVEEYATGVLGMQKLDKSQIEYLSLENGNIIDIPEQEENVFVKIKHTFEEFVEYLRG